ncbi:Hypothetical predicted protein [Cloeon dipterum]|uniref:Rad21/Rec8-like protein N-terminal domain-containing protein n=2 Tax=Cloeon dipterum TaxID=197152 RepID=A0A8S1DAU2_9INSE|nr:Hypothetical predicted protein [Cloeon dipterum]
MFYAHFVLAKKGPLARIWLAAHWDKKLTKAHVFETNIEKSVDGILQPKVKMALRTSGHLLLGVVRIYSRKAKYLLADCNEAFVKIKMAFRPGMVDLPEDNREANVNTITLPEVFHDFDTTIPELNDVDIQAQFSLNQSRAEEITMREDYGSMALATTSNAPGAENLGVDDEGFGDMLSFDRNESGPADLLRDASAADQGNLLFSDHNVTDHRADRSVRPSTSAAPQPMDIDIPIRDDGFGGNLGQDIIGTGLFEGGLFDDAPLDAPGLPPEGSSVQEEAARAAAAAAALVGVSKGDLGRAAHSDDSDDDGMDFGGAPSPMGGHSDDDDNSRPGSVLLSAGLGIAAGTAGLPGVPDIGHLGLAPDIGGDADRAADQTTLIHNEEESFALAPVDTATVKGLSKAKRKRKLIVDEVKNISGEEMKAQLSDTSDIVTTLDLAPPTKRLMHWKESGGVEKLFALPGRPIPARQLFKCYLRHLTSKPSENEDFGTYGDLDRELVLEQVRGAPDTSVLGQIADLAASGLAEVDQPHSMLMPPATPATPQKGKPGRKRKHPEEEHPPLILETPQTPLMPPVLPPDMSNLSNLLPPEHPMPTPDHLGASVLGNQLHSTPAPLMHHDQSLADPSLLLNATPHALSDQSLLHSIQQQQMPAMENLGYDQSQAPLMANMGYDDQLPPAVTPGGHGPTTPWHDLDNEEFPHSVGPPEEQQTDETYEQYEERVLNKRAAHMYQILKSRIDVSSQKPMFFSEMTHRNSRKQVAQKFYTLLVLKKFEAVELHQDKSYADIGITPGPKFDNNSSL